MAASAYQSLYRRYRPQRFDEVLGQDHVTKALRNAVRDGRVGHAYLFSGPRGTGKTSTARILAKVLNCATPEDGEPCGKCDNCVAVERGQVTDWLLEQDAASKSKVDDMRDLLDRVPFGTSGNRKVIILDEVHMLSQGAENALLKTLEEPPDHVVFVLATTDPQKVRPTIRSRTQHFGFHLLQPDVLAGHVRHIISDASLSLADDAVSHVIQAGGGSARDTLSALDQVAALGEVVSDTQPVDAILDAVADRDAGAVLVGVADAMSTGRDPRALGEAIIARLRDAFLAQMGVGAGHLPETERARAESLGERLGAAGLTRALEVLGEALTELSRKPDPRIVVEVALIRLVRPEADRSIDAVLDRLERLERAVASGGGGEGPATPPAAPPAPQGDAPPAAPSTPAGSSAPPPAPSSGPGGSAGAGGPGGSGGGGAAGPAANARAALAAQLGERRSGPARTPQPSQPAPPPSSPASAPQTQSPPPTVVAPSPAPAPTVEAPPPAPSEPPAPTTAPAPSPAPSPSDGGDGLAVAATAGDDVPDMATVTGAWSGLLAELPIPVRSKWRGGNWVEATAEGLRFEVPNEWHKKACDEGRIDVEKVLEGHFGRRVPVEVVVAGAGSAVDPSRPGSAPPGAAGGAPAPAPPADDESIDVADLEDAGDVAVGGVDLLMREFGGELIREDP